MAICHKLKILKLDPTCQVPIRLQASTPFASLSREAKDYPTQVGAIGSVTFELKICKKQPNYIVRCTFALTSSQIVSANLWQGC
jgi:hypothetical protein